MTLFNKHAIRNLLGKVNLDLGVAQNIASVVDAASASRVEAVLDSDSGPVPYREKCFFELDDNHQMMCAAMLVGADLPENLHNNLASAIAANDEYFN